MSILYDVKEFGQMPQRFALLSKQRYSIVNTEHGPLVRDGSSLLSTAGSYLRATQRELLLEFDYAPGQRYALGVWVRFLPP